MTYGPNPWQQAHWDWRAAGNFIGGGAGSGLIVATALSPAQGWAFTALMLAGLALIGLGLMCVWLEIGRPWRALNVFVHPHRSWMSREAIVAALLMPAGLVAALWWPGLVWLVALLALGFLYCQARMLRAARGIPAWRVPLLTPLIVVTGLTEGAGLWLLSAPLHGADRFAVAVLLGLLVLPRIGLWFIYRRRLGTGPGVPANRALDGAGRWLQVAGTVLPVLVLAFIGLGGSPHIATQPLLALAGLSAALPGAWFKFVLITRAGFNQGFALQRLPVRGVHHVT